MKPLKDKPEEERRGEGCDEGCILELINDGILTAATAAEAIIPGYVPLTGDCPPDPPPDPPPELLFTDDIANLLCPCEL